VPGFWYFSYRSGTDGQPPLQMQLTYFDGGSGYTTAWSVATSGNLLVGTLTDAGQKLQVDGTTATNVLQLNSISRPSSPSTGMMYSDGTNLWIYLGSWKMIV